MNLMFDPKADGLSKVLRDYQEEALRFVWSSEQGVNSRSVWLHVNEAFGGEKTINRASIINFLNGMVDEGVLDYEERSGRGDTTESTSRSWMRAVSRRPWPNRSFQVS